MQSTQLQVNRGHFNRHVRSAGSGLHHLFNWKLYKETYQNWSADNVGRLAAALAYHSAMAVAPLIIGVLAIVGLVYNTKLAQAQLVAQVQHYVGGQGAQVINTIITNANQPSLAKWAGVLSLIVLLWSASNIFAQMQDALNTTWGVKLRPDLPLWKKIQHRLMPLVVVLGIGILLIALTIAGTVLTSLGSLLTGLLPGGAILWQIVNFLISLAVITLLSAVAFKYLPDVTISWSDLWPGSLLTAVLFMIGQYILGWYLGRQSSASLYGAAGSLIVLLLWVYYSAQIFLAGAEFTEVYATRYGKGVLPSHLAVSREVGQVVKPAAEAANAGLTDAVASEPVGIEIVEGQSSSSGSRAVSARTSVYTSQGGKKKGNAKLAASDVLPGEADKMPLSRLVTSLLAEGGALFEEEIALAKAELRETVMQVERGLALLVGGGFTAYAGALFVLLAVALLLSGIMPRWFGFLLVGVLAAVEGWLLIVAGRNRLAQTRFYPAQTLESVRQDSETLRKALE